MLRIKSTIPGTVWPAVPNQGGAAILAALFQLEQSQWWPSSEHWVRQREQLGLLLRHAVETCPHYARTIGPSLPKFADDFSAETFHALPILRRADLQSYHADIASRSVPRAHGVLRDLSTSGSTGEPVRYVSSELAGFFWQVFNLRDHLWHRRDFSLKLLTLRVATRTGTMRNWFGDVGETTLETGPCVMISMELPIDEQARRVIEESPAYLTGYPNNLVGVLQAVDKLGGKLPGLKQIRSFGEAVTDEIRAYIASRWRVPLIDLYSTRETGYLALQCPDSEHYHVQSESVYLEILDERGEPCRPGETGRVVVTPLHNFAYPLIRYDLGDYAEVGESCSCGRELPVIRRIFGRSRNLMKLRDGRSFWPLIGSHSFLDIAPIRQYQLVQLSYDELEVRLTLTREMTADEQKRLGEHLLGRLGYPFRLHWRFMSEIPYNAGGKFEDFIRAFDP